MEISHVIQENQNNNDLDAYFAKAGSCRSVCSTITSHWPLKSQIYQELEEWLSSEDAASIANSIDFIRQNNEAKMIYVALLTYFMFRINILNVKS